MEDLIPNILNGVFGLPQTQRDLNTIATAAPTLQDQIKTTGAAIERLEKIKIGLQVASTAAVVVIAFTAVHNCLKR